MSKRLKKIKAVYTGIGGRYKTIPEDEFDWLIAQAKRAETLIERCAQIAEKWQAAYPVDVFTEPPPGEHGETVDACSARAGRKVAAGIARDIRQLKEEGSDE